MFICVLVNLDAPENEKNVGYTTILLLISKSVLEIEFENLVVVMKLEIGIDKR